MTGTVPTLPDLADVVEIGRGGFAVVYRARQLAFDREVAVKVLERVDGDAQARFARECRAIGGLSWHPAIVTVHGDGILPDGRPFLVMELLAGGSLGDRSVASGDLTYAEVLGIGVRVSGALAAAHEAGRLHRDVKPDNLLLTGYGEVKLADFGIASLTGERLTRTGVLTATLAHAAPEVLGGEPATDRSDVYSLGSTLYALLAGQAPFVRPTDESLYAVIARVVSEPTPDLRALGVPGAIAVAVEAALAKEPGARPSAAELGRSLQAVEMALGLTITPLVVAPGLVETPARSAAGDAAPGAHGRATAPAPASGSPPRGGAPTPTGPGSPGSPGSGTTIVAPRTPAPIPSSTPAPAARRRLPWRWLAAAGLLAGAGAVSLLSGQGDDNGARSGPIDDVTTTAAGPGEATTTPTTPAETPSTTDSPESTEPPSSLAEQTPSRADHPVALMALDPLDEYTYGPIEPSALTAVDAELDDYDPSGEILDGYAVVSIEREGAAVGALVVYALSPDHQAPGPFLASTSVTVERERTVGTARVVSGRTPDGADAVAWYAEPWGLVVVGTDPARLDTFVDAWLAEHPTP